MHLTLAVFGLIILPNLVDPLPRIDAVAYHQSIFKRPATVSSTQKYGQIISADSKSKCRPNADMVYVQAIHFGYLCASLTIPLF